MSQVGKAELYVKKIRNGTVIDHISAGYALDVLKILNVTGKETNTVGVVINVPSKHIGKKDIVKIEGGELKPEDVDKIALISPKATINIIHEYDVVEKKKVSLPRDITGIIKCGNPVCISNSKEPVSSLFHVQEVEPIRLRCHYCNRTMEKKDILKQF
ncbi:MAG: aspartate carbamoyltransferase regulatory subunit [Candidatus Bathyarchaeota archaeon]|jgi:aspartate carbamoyltransferase regulatory subunit|nr:aspartate carbamoyltransferase regulatory subunit [Candidatus Bathyarchaeota archaeon]